MREAALSVMISLLIILTSVMVINSLLLVILITVMISVAFSRTSTGHLHNRSAKTIPDASIESSSPSSPIVPASSSRSWKYDVFLSFRGEDTRKTFVDHLYSALVERVTCTYKDDVTLLRGDTIGPSLLSAIEESQIAIIIFSENYANSSWCLDELAYIMKCNKEGGKIVMPIFYHVDPSDVRKQKKKYKEAFAKHIENNSLNKVDSWRKALVAAGNIAGWEINHNVNGYEAKCIKDIVGTVLDRLLYSNSVIDENLVGMGTRLQDLRSQLEIGLGGVRMIGIWGIGGSGKTTLASSLYIEIASKFDSCCFLENIKEESSMKTLQEKILSSVLKVEVNVENVDEGKQTIKTRLGRKNVLLLLDDIDDRKQLEALAGSHYWFGDGSRIIITSRNEQLLRTHRVDEISHVSLLSDEEAMRLFYRRAYNESKPVEDYTTLSHRVVSYAAGLPLALIVLGSFLYDKNKEEWISTLDRLKDIPEMEIVNILKISFDGLAVLEKELFLDIACFFREKKKDKAMEMLDACGFHPVIGVKVLIQKALITINSYGAFDMHDLIQEMGHYIVRGEHPNNPERHSRLWRDEEIKDICYTGNETMKNYKTEAIICHGYPSGFGKFLSKAKKLRLLSVQTRVKIPKFPSIHNNDQGVIIEVPEYLSNELQYLYWDWYPASPFPETFQLRKLVVLRLKNILQEELWSGYKCLPSLKELHLDSTTLVRTPDFVGLPCLQKLTLSSCDKLEEIHPSLGNHKNLVYVYVEYCSKLKDFPTIVQMGKLKILDISYRCEALSKFPKIEANMGSLINLSLKDVMIEVLPSTVGKYCTNLTSLILENCSELKSIEGNFHALKHLQKCKISGYRKVIMQLPKDLFNERMQLEEFYLYSVRQTCIPHLPCFLTRLTLCQCGLKDGEIPCGIGELSNLQVLDLRENEFSRLNISLLQLTRLKLLSLSYCEKLVELPKLPTSIAILNADRCSSLEVIGDINKDCKWLCQVSLRILRGRNVIGGDRLLQNMLQGNATENGCMLLLLKDIEIPNGFIPRLLRGWRSYRLELPENWYNHFSGFLICAVFKTHFSSFYQIHMKHPEIGMDTVRQDVYWEESDGYAGTLAFYVSFASLKHTTWFDPTSTNIEFSLKGESETESFSGFGVGLVSKTSQSETNAESYSDNYRPKFSIVHDSESHLECQCSTSY